MNIHFCECLLLKPLAKCEGNLVRKAANRKKLKDELPLKDALDQRDGLFFIPT